MSLLANMPTPAYTASFVASCREAFLLTDFCLSGCLTAWPRCTFAFRCRAFGTGNTERREILQATLTKGLGSRFPIPKPPLSPASRACRRALGRRTSCREPAGPPYRVTNHQRHGAPRHSCEHSQRGPRRLSPPSRRQTCRPMIEGVCLVLPVFREFTMDPHR
jgi:hypothetical protein